MKSARAFARGIVSFLFPVRCLGCSRWVPDGDAGPSILCTGCALRLAGLTPPAPLCPRCDAPLGTGRPGAGECAACRGWEPAVVTSRSAALLSDPADTLVHALKYGGWRRAVDPMARAMAERWRRAGCAVDFLVPVPTTRARVRKRGYNQAGLLAVEIGAVLGLPVVEALSRRAGGSSQIALHPLHRKANVQRAFAVRSECFPTVAESRILIVDDVLTTGATGGEVARVLAEAGATSVHLLTFARAMPERRSGS